MTSATVSQTRVWERLWRQRPTAKNDADQVLREQRNPRWAIVHAGLTAEFGQITGLRTIELGCGRGDLSALLAACGARVTLLDRSDTGLAQARRRFERLNLKADFVSGDLLADPGRLAERFDVSCSLGVIEHFRAAERARALAAHRAVLHDGGMAVVSVPHAMGLPYRLWKLYLEARRLWPYGTEIPYSKGELRRRARAAGFHRVELHASGFWQSIGDHWGRSILGLTPDWIERRSWLDSAFGGTLTMLARVCRR